MRKAGGYSQIVSPDAGIANYDHLQRVEVGAGLTETDTFTCFHCGSVVHVMPKQDPSSIGGMCKMCYKLICPKCLDKPCKPWEKQMEELESALMRRQAVSEY